MAITLVRAFILFYLADYNLGSSTFTKSPHPTHLGWFCLLPSHLPSGSWYIRDRGWGQHASGLANSFIGGTL